MPRGVSRAKHPEMYGGAAKTSSKTVGTGRRGTRRVKTGGRTSNLQSSGSNDLERIQVLSNIRAALSGNRDTNVNSIVGKVDQILNIELDNVISTYNTKDEDNDERSDSTIVERPMGSAPAFNPPGPAPSPGTYAAPARS